MSFPKCVTMTKNTPMFQILHIFAPLNNVRAYIAWSWKTTLIMWLFLRAWYPTSNTSAPPGHVWPKLSSNSRCCCNETPPVAEPNLIFYPGVQFRFSLRESNLIATIAITIGFNERNWFSYVDAAQIITRIVSLILVEFAALFTRTTSEKSTKLCM